MLVRLAMKDDQVISLAYRHLATFAYFLAAAKIGCSTLMKIKWAVCSETISVLITIDTVSLTARMLSNLGCGICTTHLSTFQRFAEILLIKKLVSFFDHTDYK